MVASPGQQARAQTVLPAVTEPFPDVTLWIPAGYGEL